GGGLTCSGAKLHNADGNALNAVGATVKDGIFLNDGFSATGVVQLPGADVGELNCSGAKLTNVGRYALIADGARVRGSVLLNQGFSATGIVRLQGADIGATLDCGGARLDNRDGDALNVSGV